MKVYPIDPATFITEPITVNQRHVLSVLARHHSDEVSQIKTKSQATKFISDHIFEYYMYCDLRDAALYPYFGRWLTQEYL